jgi:hypothetical protein
MAQGFGSVGGKEKIMFISNKEKTDISEKLEHNKTMMDSLVKHMGKLQVEVQNSDVTQIPALVDSNKRMNKSYWAYISKFKAVQNHIKLLQVENNLLVNQVESLVARVGILENSRTVDSQQDKKPSNSHRSRLVISSEKVQEMKDAGIWDDPIRRVGFIDQLIKDEQEKKVKAQKEKQRQYSRNYYLRKKAERLAKEAA